MGLLGVWEEMTGDDNSVLTVLQVRLVLTKLPSLVTPQCGIESDVVYQSILWCQARLETHLG